METLLDLLPRIERLGTREAVRFWNGYRTWHWTYRDLDDGIRRFVAYLDGHGIGPGDRVVLWSENRPEWVAVFWACLARGVQVVPLDHQSSPEFVDRIVAQTDARLLVHGDTPALPTAVLKRFAIQALENLRDTPRFTPTTVTRDDVAEIIFTSGTTAEPKGVIHLHRNICANLDPIREEIDRYKRLAYAFQPIRILDLLPLSHMFGQSLGIFVPVLLECAAAFMTDLHPAAIRQAVRREKISVLVCVPRILDSLRAHIERRHPSARVGPGRMGGPLTRWWRHRAVHRDLGLKFWAFVVGGAKLDPDTERYWAGIGLLVIQGYGLTETSPVISVNHPFRARRGTLGEVIGGQEIRIAHDGEILVRGPSVVDEYLESGARRTRTVDEDGWLHTGDIGEQDPEGRLVYRSRKKDVIITANGMNVYPEDVERELTLEAGVRDAVVAAESATGDAIHAALILANPSEDTLAIVERVNRRLEPHQRIRSASEWPEAEFPRTPSTFKTQRRKVAERLSLAGGTPAKGGASGLDEILTSLTRRRAEDLSDDQRLEEDLGLSSLERIDVLASIEDHYGIELDEASFSSLSTVGQVRTWAARQSTEAATVGREIDRDEARAKATQQHIQPPRWARRQPVRAIRNAIRWALILPLFRHYIPLSITGWDNLDQLDPPVIFAANHSSHLDTVALFAALPGSWQDKLAPAARQQFFFPSGAALCLRGRIKMRTAYILACGLFNAYPLSQDLGGVRDSLRYTGEMVESGFCPLIYPEGRFTPDGSLQAFQAGIGLMAARLAVPVVPIYLKGLFEIMPMHESWPRKGSVSVRFGAPVTAEAGEDYVRLATRIEARLRQMEASSKA